METNGKLVLKKWIEWRQFNIRWAHGSYDDTDTFCKYADKLEPKIQENAVSWKILYYPNKDNYAITREFESYSRPIFDSIFEAKEKNGAMKSIIRANELKAFIEYSYVQCFHYLLVS